MPWYNVGGVVVHRNEARIREGDVQISPPPTPRHQWDGEKWVASPASPQELPANVFWALVDDVGLRPSIDAAVDAIEDTTTRRIMRAKLRAPVFAHDSGVMADMRARLDIDDATFDALWADGEDLRDALMEEG